MSLMPGRTPFLRGLGPLVACGLALAPAAGMGQGAAPPPAVERPVPVFSSPPPAFGGPGEEEPKAARADTSPATEDRAAPAVAGEQRRQPAPQGAAEPGRQEPPPTAAPALPVERQLPTARQREVARAFECPRRQIARMLETAVEESEVSASMGLELQILVLCRDRWKVLKDIMDSELSLSAILRSDRVAREKAALELEERRRVARARIEGARAGAEAAAKEVEERRLVKDEIPAVEKTAEEPEEEPETVVVVEAPAPETHEKYGWFTIIGGGGVLRAGVTDGDGRWMVGEGDSLPDGTRVTRISARPPKVGIAGGPPSGLPYRGIR